MANRKSEKDELMEKVFGKSSPNRSITEDDMKILQNANTSFSKELDELMERSKIMDKQTNSLLEAANEVFQAGERMAEYNNERIKNQTSGIYNRDEMEDLRKQIISDFGEDVQQESVINISNDQIELFNRFTDIEKVLNTLIINQPAYLKALCTAFRRPFVVGQQESGINSSILISGADDTGRHTSINEIARLMKENEILSNSNVAILDLRKYNSKEDENNFIIDLYGAINNAYIIVFDNIDQCSASYLAYLEEILLQGKLSLNKRYVLNNKQLTETSTALAKNTVKELNFKGKCLVYITVLKTKKLLNILGSRFLNGLSDILTTESFTDETIHDLYINKLAYFQTRALTNLNMRLRADDTVGEYIKRHYDGSNALFVNRFFEQLYNGLSQFKLDHPFNDTQDALLSCREDELYFNDTKLSDYLPTAMNNAIEEVRKELDALVGLEEVKRYIYSLQDFYAAQKLKQSQGFEGTEISKHMIFTGNPGTGKTTIARLLAKYLKAIGVLSNGQLIEVSRNDLVGKYVGHTAPLTMQVINSAMGGILFIDEAYSLYRGENDSFGLESIDTLVKAMEDNREDLIVILAGYTKEMKVFLESNSGLQSRFPNQIEFPDYTGEELYEIAKINARSAGYQIDENAAEKLTEYFTKVQENDSVRSGNGRLSRNLVEKAIINQSTRILKDNGQLDLLLLEDFNLE